MFSHFTIEKHFGISVVFIKGETAFLVLVGGGKTFETQITCKYVATLS